MSEQGLYPKYTVIKNATGEEVFNAFVLKPDVDEHARAALRAYADSVEASNPNLASDLRWWLHTLKLSGRGG